MTQFLSYLLGRFPLGFRQLQHNIGRLLFAVLGIAFADVLVFTNAAFHAALLESNSAIHASWDADVVIVSEHAESLEYISSFPRRLLYRSMAVQEVESVTPVRVEMVDWFGPLTRERTSFMLVGVDPETMRFKSEQVNTQLRRIRRFGGVLFDRRSRGDYGPLVKELESGRPIDAELNDKAIRLEGLVTIGASFAADGYLFSSNETFHHVIPGRHPGEVNVGVLHLRSGADVDTTIAALNELYQGQGIQVMSGEGFVEMEERFQAEDSESGFLLGFGLSMGFVIGLAIIYQVLYSDVSEHLREYATLKAIGRSDAYFMGVIAEQSVILSILGFLVAVLASLWIYDFSASATDLPIRMPLSRLVLVFLLTLSMCFAAGVLATRRLARADPADIF